MSNQNNDNSFPTILLFLTLLFAVSLNKKPKAADEPQIKIGRI